METMIGFGEICGMEMMKAALESVDKIRTGSREDKGKERIKKQHVLVSYLRSFILHAMFVITGAH